MPTKAEFAASIKAKYPQYKDVADDELVSAMLAKYPQYKGQIEEASTGQSLASRMVSPGQAVNEDGVPVDKQGNPIPQNKGFFQSIGDSLFQSAARPGVDDTGKQKSRVSTVGDLLSLIIPSEFHELAPTAKAVTKSATAAATDAKPGILNRLKAFIGNVHDAAYPPEMPELSQPARPAAAQTVNTSEDVIDRAMREARSAKAPPPGTRGRPGITADAYQNLTDEAGNDLGTSVSGPAERPSGPWDNNVSADGAPKSLDDAIHEALIGKLGGTASDAELHTGGDALTSEPPASGPAPQSYKIDPATLSKEDWLQLRRQYGAKKLSALTGVHADDIRATYAPGPSRIPLEAEDRINAFNAKQAMDRDK